MSVDYNDGDDFDCDGDIVMTMMNCHCDDCGGKRTTNDDRHYHRHCCDDRDDDDDGEMIG